MRDPVIRAAFHNKILKVAHNDIDTFVLDELGLRNGEIRADIAVLNGKLIGYEIKTEKDNLSRLPAQVKAYNEVFDKSFIIVSKKHLDKAVSVIPDWWGIYLIEPKNEEFKFLCFRKAKINKQQKTYSLAQLLWKAEALEVANILSQNVKANTNKDKVYDLISQKCSSKKLSKIVLKYLKQRENWRTSRVLPS